jgi:hypothetical protein
VFFAVVKSLFFITFQLLSQVKIKTFLILKICVSADSFDRPTERQKNETIRQTGTKLRVFLTTDSLVLVCWK